MKKFKLIVLFYLALLNFVTNIHAADTFDAPSQTLTIPLVTVGNTTFSNVVLKLNDFEVLQVSPNPLVGEISSGFLIQFVSAVKKGNEVTVTLTMTSQFQDRKAIVGRESGCNGSYVCAEFTDDKGNVYQVTSTQVGSVKENSWINFPFVADIPMTVIYNFSNIATNATSISLLSLNLRNVTDNNHPALQLRNVPFQLPTSTSLQ